MRPRTSAQRTEVPLVEIQGVGRDAYAPAVIPRRPPCRGIVPQVGKHPGNPVHHPDTFQCDLGRHPRPAAVSIQAMSSRPTAVSGQHGIRHRQPARDRAGRPRTCRRPSAETDRFPVRAPTTPINPDKSVRSPVTQFFFRRSAGNTVLQASEYMACTIRLRIAVSGSCSERSDSTQNKLSILLRKVSSVPNSPAGATDDTNS